jgi:hypothetical protein
MAALALLLGRAPAPVVLAVAVLGGCCGPMVTGGLSSLVAGLVEDGPGRDRAYSWDAATYNAAAVTAPAAVSLVAALGSAAPAMALLALAAAVAAALAATLPYRAPKPGPYGPGGRTAGLRAGLGAGLAALWRIRELRAITSATTLAFVGIGSLTTVSVLLATRLGRPGDGGVLMTAFAVGALVGTLTVGRLSGVEPGRLARWAMAATGAALAVTALSPSIVVGAVLFGVAGVCDGPILTATLRTRSQYAPEAVRTQVFTLGAGLKLTAGSVGAALVGLSAAAPPQSLLLGIAVVVLASALLHARLARVPVPAAAPVATARSAASATAPAGRPTPGVR